MRGANLPFFICFLAAALSHAQDDEVGPCSVVNKDVSNYQYHLHSGALPNANGQEWYTANWDLDMNPILDQAAFYYNEVTGILKNSGSQADEDNVVKFILESSTPNVDNVELKFSLKSGTSCYYDFKLDGVWGWTISDIAIHRGPA